MQVHRESYRALTNLNGANHITALASAAVDEEGEGPVGERARDKEQTGKGRGRGKRGTVVGARTSRCSAQLGVTRRRGVPQMGRSAVSEIYLPDPSTFGRRPNSVGYNCCCRSSW